MKKILLLICLVLSIILVSCSPENTSKEPIPQKISDSRFNGNYSVYETREGFSNSDGYYYVSLSFDGTNQFSEYSKYLYWNGYQWIYSGDYIGDNFYFIEELEINSNKTEFRKRLWNNKYSTWTEWTKYEFLNGNNVLRIYSSSGSFTDYTKQ